MFPVRTATIAGLTLLLGTGPSLDGRIPSTRGQFDPAAHFDDGQLSRLRDGRSAVATSAGPANELAVTVAGQIAITPERLLAWGRQVELVQATSLVPSSGRFSDPPRFEDLADLQLSEDDLRDLLECRPRACGIKLAASEIADVRAAIGAAPRNWKTAAGEAFKRILVARASSFAASGLQAAPPFDDHKKTVVPSRELDAILSGPEQSIVWRAGGNDCVKRDAPKADSYLLWSKNVADGAREVITITQLTIERCGPTSAPVLVSTQLYASHYLDASISYTTLATDGTHQYLLYLRRVRVDLLRGFWRPIIRSILENEIRKSAPALLDQIRKRLEAGEPPCRTVPTSGR